MAPYKTPPKRVVVDYAPRPAVVSARDAFAPLIASLKEIGLVTRLVERGYPVAVVVADTLNRVMHVPMPISPASTRAVSR